MIWLWPVSLALVSWYLLRKSRQPLRVKRSTLRAYDRQEWTRGIDGPCWKWPAKHGQQN